MRSGQIQKKESVWKKPWYIFMAAPLRINKEVMDGRENDLRNPIKKEVKEDGIRKIHADTGRTR